MSNFEIGSPPATPQQWVDYLHSKLLMARGTYRKFSEYYDGNHQKMAFAQARHKKQYAELFERWCDNFSGLIVDSVNERMAIDGFRMTDEPDADKDAQEIWQRNFMDSDSNEAHLDALIYGIAYAVVWADKDGKPTITVESAENMVVQYKPGSRREIEAAAKFYTDDWGREWVTLWLPDAVYRFMNGADAGWVGNKREKNPLGEIPVIPINNRSRIAGDPISDLSVVIPIQDAINKIVSDALLASEYAAWPQRWVTGLEIREDENGNPIQPFDTGVDKVLQADDPASKFGQFEAANLGNYVTLVDMLVQHMASISRIPFHYFLLGGGAAPSGESITSAEAGLISKTRERMLHFGEAWERVMRLCFRVMSDPRAEAFGAEVMWRDPENRTEAQHMDALLKLKMIGVPVNQLLSDAGYTPQQIARFQEMRKQDAKDATEIQKLMPQPEIGTAGPPGSDKQGPGAKPAGVDSKAAKAAVKPPQGNANNQARKTG